MAKKNIFSFLKKPSLYFSLIVLIYVLFFLITYYYVFQKNISGFFHIGKKQAIFKNYLTKFNYLALSPWGYDGQFYLAVAHDPFLKEKLYRFLDGPAYRYSKLFFPLTGYLVSLGKKPLIAENLVFLNFILFFISLYFFKHLVEEQRSPPFVIFLYGFLPCFTIGLFFTTPDAFAVSLILISIYFLNQNKNGFACLFMTFAVLTKESALILPFSAMIYFLLKKEFKKSFLFFLPIILYFALAGWIYLELGKWPFLGNLKSVNFPFIHLIQEIVFLLHRKFSPTNVLKIIWFVNCFFAFILSLIAFLQERTILTISYLLSGLFVVSVSSVILENFLGFGRVTSLIGIFCLLFYLRKKEKLHLLPSLIFVLTSFLFLGDVLLKLENYLPNF